MLEIIAGVFFLAIVVFWPAYTMYHELPHPWNNLAIIAYLAILTSVIVWILTNRKPGTTLHTDSKKSHARIDNYVRTTKVRPKPFAGKVDGETLRVNELLEDHDD